MSAVAPAPSPAAPARVGPRPGTARAALAHPVFRRVWLGVMAANVGTWMRNIALGAFALKLTGSASFVSLIGFAQLGPILVLSTVGGGGGGPVDQRRIIQVLNAQQLVLSCVLAAVAWDGSPSRRALFLAVLALGVGNALQGPSMSSLLPTLVPRQDLPGAVSLFSAQMNLSRVVGPAIGGLLIGPLGFHGVFLLTGFSSLSSIAATMKAPPPAPRPAGGARGLRALLSGFGVARRNRTVGTVLATIATFSFLCLPFIGLMPVIAERNLGLDTERSGYGLLYASFGLGAAIGALGVGSWFVDVDRQRLVRASMLAFAGLLAVFGLLRSAPPAYLVVPALAAAYFTAVTALSTTMQEHLSDATRGRVMALYMMAFGGTVPLGLLAFGALSDRIGLTPVLLVGSAVAVVLAVVVRLDRAPALDPS